MTTLGKIVTRTAGAALVLFGAVAAVRQQGPPKLDVDSLASRLGLSTEAKQAITPGIDELNAILARRAQTIQDSEQLRARLLDAQQKIAEALTPEQQQEVLAAFRQAWGHGSGAGHMGGVIMGGYMGAGHMGGTSMGGYMGAGHMGNGVMGSGHGVMGAYMGGGHMGSGFMGRQN